MPEETINAAIDQAVAEAEEQGVIGKESTPFLLARVAELTGGDSLKSNIQLVLITPFWRAKLPKNISVSWVNFWWAESRRPYSSNIPKHGADAGFTGMKGKSLWI